MDSKDIIKKLNLEPHQEGGYFSEVYRSGEIIERHCLPERYDGGRAFSTSIYFLLEDGQKSHLHRLKSDETWHFYLGSSLLLYILSEAEGYRNITLGSNILDGEWLQVTIPRGCWFGAEVIDGGSFSLVGCTVAPGFDFCDFELGDKSYLLSRFPEYGDVISRLAIG